MSDASIYAAYKGWNTVAKAIEGGAEFISSSYVNSEKLIGGYDQQTVYEMKWNPEGLVKYGYATGEYATSSTWANSIASIIKQYSDVFKGKHISFIIPEYN
uniref:CAZy families GH73 protein n=1 Tax=uncultured Ethanoligenens sp. TaxID=286556 RepID=A0A060C286_9FIRM|nr:CAZy families GH73 protein [uncultured Ethanoligenens sp.]